MLLPVKGGFVYIMASGRNGTLYTGVTSDLAKRAWEHRNGFVAGFTKRYGCKLLVWYEVHEDLQEARLRELQMKKWKRQWKLSEIERMNPDWRDLYPRLFEGSWRSPSGPLPSQGHTAIRDSGESRNKSATILAVWIVENVSRRRQTVRIRDSRNGPPIDSAGAEISQNQRLEPVKRKGLS